MWLGGSKLSRRNVQIYSMKKCCGEQMTSDVLRCAVSTRLRWRGDLISFSESSRSWLLFGTYQASIRFKEIPCRQVFLHLHFNSFHTEEHNLNQLKSTHNTLLLVWCIEQLDAEFKTESFSSFVFCLKCIMGTCVGKGTRTTDKHHQNKKKINRHPYNLKYLGITCDRNYLTDASLEMCPNSTFFFCGGAFVRRQ